VLHLDAAAVQQLLPWPDLVQALRAMFVAGCEAPLRHTHLVRPGAVASTCAATNTRGNAGAAAGASDRQAGTVLLMPAWQPGRHLGIKTVAVFPGNTNLGLPSVNASYALFNANTGQLLAHMDGGELTARRTAAASALAASFLARPDAQRLLLVGAGRVASLMAPALRVVRPGLHQVTVFSRRMTSAQLLVTRLREQGFDAQASDDLPNATRQADIISCATLATQAWIHGDWLAPGSHLDLVGAFTPQMREADGLCLARARVFVDGEEALHKAGDITQAVAEGHFELTRVQGDLQGLCRGQVLGRQMPAEITLFKSVGNALEDLAAAGLAWDQAAPRADNAALVP
jgi:ornithine cyclodeaminase/alanine dehydrogenase-like protein (mu-crystallin family)